VDMKNLPPYMSADDQVILFDGVCKLCSFWARFLIRFDHQHQYQLATVQSPEGVAILEWCGLPTSEYNTLVFLQGATFHVRSAAVLKVLVGLSWPWKLAGVLWLIPRPLRDWLYDRVAQNRYRIFGRYNTCMMPTPDHLQRFLSAK
jgi:predicted DCC family thiol-disulfide oxidoreductase YuxK